MRVVLYEWCMSGGLAGGDAPIVREGRSMLEALAADAAREPSLEVVALVEEGRAIDLPTRARVVPVPAGADVDRLVTEAREADWTVVVAPESDGVLAGLARAVRDAGGRLLAPAGGVIDAASDKQATIDALAARGVPVPAGRALAPGTVMPAEFHLPAARKARLGCGGEGLEILASPDVAPVPVPTRLEAFVPGLPVGAACICGPRSTHVLPPMRQVFTASRQPRYLGSDPLADAALASRASALAVRAVAALGADGGWVGVDMILGPRSDGRDDRVLEVNPRLTTSFVGLTRLYASSLVATMIDTIRGYPTGRLAVVQPSATCSFRLPGA